MVENDEALKAGIYSRPVNYTYNRNIGKSGGFYYVFNEGGLNCSKAAIEGNDVCIVSPKEMNSLRSIKPNIVYLDCGAWVDNADGNNTSRRDFGLVVGENVYLCEFVRNRTNPQSINKSVQELFKALEKENCGVKVVKYAKVKGPLAKNTPEDPNLYIFLGDFHLPPVNWFYKEYHLQGILPNNQREPPDWLLNLAAFRRQKNYLYRNYYTLAQIDREKKRRNIHQSDIFGSAGSDLIFFLNGLCNLSLDIKKKLHFIHLGDMFELWLGRDYQYKPGYRDPQWVSDESIDLVSDWALEIIIQNEPVIDAFNKLYNSKMAEVKFLWGNHDAYLRDVIVTSQLNLPKRDPTYVGLNGDLFAEHGHRFDRSNHDNVSAWSGPAGAKAAYYVPVVRKAEPFARKVTSIGHPSEILDCHLLGASLIYLYQKYDLQRNPFNIYVMGHSHNRQLFTFKINTEYHLYEQP